MNVLPVIARELRATSRQGTTYWMRVGGAAAALVAVALFASSALERSIQGSGAIVFATVHRVVFFSIWLGVPWLVADCISRERREGTLGLLFLTSLRPTEIVLAKVLVHSVRAFSLWLAVLPVMSLAFFLGGVGWLEAVASVAISFSSVCMALGAGLIATSVARQWLHAMVLATCLSLVALYFFFALWADVSPLLNLASNFGAGTRGVIAPIYYAGIPGSPVYGSFGPMGSPMGPPTIMLTVSGIRDPLLKMVTRVGMSLCWLGVMILLAAGRVKRVWQEVPPPIWLQRLDEVFCRPRYWTGFFRAWLKWQLERNPIGWLEQRRWTGRTVVWAWFAVIISIYSGVFSNPQMFTRGFDEVQIFLNGGLLLFLSTSAAGSFRRERETGVLELLLISPISEQRIIGGRLRGLWGKFLPTLALMTFVWISFPPWMGQQVAWPEVVFFLTAFAALPVIGLYQSLRRQLFLSALLWTFVWGVVVPFLAPEFILLPARLLAALLTLGRDGAGLLNSHWLVPSIAEIPGARMLLAAIAQVLLALGFGGLLHRNLAQRKFALDRVGE